MANQGIMHLSFTRGGKTFCNMRLAIMSTTVEEAHKWGTICKRCEANLRKMEERRARRAQKEQVGE